MPKKTGLELVWYGSTAKTYSAFFGSWKKVTEGYAALYGKQGRTYNTGRVSIAVKQLKAAGFLAAAADAGSNWKIYTATLEPIYLEARERGVTFNAEEREAIETLLGCAAGKAPGTHTEPLVEFHRNQFTPAIAQCRDALHAVVALAMVYLFFKELEGGKLDAYLSALRSAIDGAPKKEKNASAAAFSDLAGKLALTARASIDKGKPVEDTFLFRLARYLHHPQAVAELTELAKQSF